MKTEIRFLPTKATETNPAEPFLLFTRDNVARKVHVSVK